MERSDPFGCANHKLKMFLLGDVLWMIWNTRNKLVIEGKCPNSPTDVLHKILFYFVALAHSARGC